MLAEHRRGILYPGVRFCIFESGVHNFDIAQNRIFYFDSQVASLNLRLTFAISS